MQTTDACVLSVYRTIASLDSQHSVFLVQHVYSNKIYVKKELSVYSRQVYDYIKQNPIPNMPRIFELVENNGMLIVIEEYISGDTLQYTLDNHGPLSEQEVIDITLQLCGILRHLHHASPVIVHRDIKPSNIIISPDGIVKLLDINAAKQYSPQNNQDTRMMGTVGYAAPEQYGFMQSSIQSDIYSVGVLMNVLLTGQLPSAQRSAGHLGSIIQKCLEMAPKDRYASIDELARAVSNRNPVESPAISQPQYRRSWQKYLPPGIRSLQMPNTGFALLGYLFVFWITLSLEVQDGSVRSVIINRIGASVAALLIILLSGNYLDIQKLLPLTKSNNKFLQFIGIVLFDFLILFVVILLVGIAES